MIEKSGQTEGLDAGIGDIMKDLMTNVPGTPAPLPRSMAIGIAPAIPVRGAAAETTMKTSRLSPIEFFFKLFTCSGVACSMASHPR